MRRLILSCCLSLAIPVSVSAADAPAAATELARDAIIVDTHIDAPGALRKKWADLGMASPDREFDYPRARAGGLDVAFMSIYTSAAQDDDGSAWQVANTMIDAVQALAARHPDKFAILTSPGDVDGLLDKGSSGGGRVLLPMGMENGAPIGDDIQNLKFFFDRGVRYITLAHSANNRISDSSYALEKKWNGLSPFGREVVTEMNRLGIMVDVSHLSDAAVKQAVELSTVPVIASHSALRHFTPGFERNLSDGLLKAIADKGGVVQIPFGNAFVNPLAAADVQAYFIAAAEFNKHNKALQAAGKPIESEKEFEDAWDAAHPSPPTRIEAVLDQVDHAVKLVGVDHVGIGSDFDGVSGNLPDTLHTVADFPNFVAGLQARGYDEADIRKILGGNLLRVWTAIEAGAQAR